MNALWVVMRALLGIVGALVALLLAFFFLLPIINPPPKTYRFVFPAETRRTENVSNSAFRLRTMIPGAPTLPREEGFRLVTFDQSNPVDTSEEYVFGHEYFREEHYILSVDGARRKADGIWCTPTPSVEHVPVVVSCNAR
jgi:hypothetical protein